MRPWSSRSPFHPAVLTHCVAVTLVLWVWGSPSLVAAERPAPDLGAGKDAYRQHCARCHGATGRGDGVDAKRFYPRPRDLALGVYKFRSTASGTPPTDENLFQTISQGLPGSNMPDWQHLDEGVRWQIVAYLRSLSPVFEKVQPAPVQLADDPGPARADHAKGKALYETLGCAACHGSAGRANGPSAGGLVDDWGMPIRPANLTQGWSYRGGHDPRSVMLRVLTGIDGAGMPSYAEALSPEEAWHLAYYVTSLQEPVHWNLVARAVRVDDSLPSAVDDPRWAEADRTDLQLDNVVNATGEWASPPTVNAASLEAVYNDEAIAFRFTWDDPTQDLHAPHDGFALLLKPVGSEGDVVTLQAWPSAGAPPLDVCYWSAERGTAWEAVATDFDSVTTPSVSTPPFLQSASGYQDGRWRMVVQRALHPNHPRGAAVVTTEAFTSIAVAVWDGGNPGSRAVSSWIDIALREP
ncbi:MAG: c-type cytochrome [Candidatus Omnitrophica bacterium]|nr:c-type cytochrome [Candidatus Omnitrophota bacterium]